MLLIVKLRSGVMLNASVPPESVCPVTTGVKASVNVGTAADARPLHVAFDVVIVELVVTLVGTGEPPLHFVAVALMVATSDAMVALVNGGENLMVPVTLVQVVSPVPVVLDRAALAEPTPIVATAASGRTNAPAASMSFRVTFTCPP
jgi:hypothetical protein